jgi:hypothetical protein
VGSKLRRLRAKAGVTGHAHQKRQREAARRKEHARLRVVGSASGRLGLEAAIDGAGKLEPEAKAGIEQALAEATAPAPVGALPFVPFLPLLQARLEERRIELAHVLGSHDGAEELADAITLAARSSVDSADEVWERALAELRRGVPPAELSALRKPDVAKSEWHIHRPGGRSRTLATLLALSMMAGLAVPPKRER